MALGLDLPDESGRLARYQMRAAPVAVSRPPHQFNRIAFSAAHVVADPFSAREPSLGPSIDWKATLAFRRRLLDLGLHIAEAMDTAQRGFGLDWTGALELARRTLESCSAEERGRVFTGVGTDQLAPADARDLDDVVRAYGEQLQAVQKLGGRVILMASRALAKLARGPQDYARVYQRVLAQAEQPVILHWLGEMFDPALSGYWGAQTFKETLETALTVIGENAAKVEGIKISLLDAEKEIVMRRRLPPQVRMYTGDDFNYPELIKGDAQGFSHALLGIFDPIASAASAALAALARGNAERFTALLAPTVPLSRLLFRAPTQFYKTGVVFLAYLNGFQDHFVMLGGAQSMRPLPYFVEAFKLADAAGVLEDPERAAQRMRAFLRLYGV